MNKSQIRKQLLQIRNDLPNKDLLSEDIANKVINYINQNFTTPKIASFLSLKNEVNTKTVNNYFEVYLPIIHPFIKHGLWFAKDTKSYYKNKYKINEPIYSITKVIAPWELDIIIIPLVGFNKQKYRMGMGGGFYDYSLDFKKNFNYPLSIGIAFDEQQNNDIIIDRHDIQLDVIITPTRIL
ncbi:5-formyltetrahydrofolate cyclo-ligase [Allofrancisella frigidaquae]|uniref:5-formyltetrahydrofolate cyclo-ligase n=1 Tax=Allofrancisella frigidaquae TaxID=1085644 RepID=A0A6M3HU84_9GAMM|nr:5-formyltetrahydrofolate cyclo-ligase [Allofrancisella frigidaquae]KEI35757.1 5-formyltetrahydrofolate cyclo-ligase [Francisella sp. W12-1067]QIV94637.1 5-formyltetrahydrofolate cyclo-ligase [Allofrancisella frigidaquae]